ncbi:DoxX family protein [Actinopolyspora erythraea]|uniref:DoxX family protein n=1 Tax=Actinopolyspora erythraea TaxID=414996 RepID=A0A099DBD4_9ACTN|nr:DoxX family protein [Actinopolyspora erythraea]ASU77067.1 DoxX family protein [Actinopolyspora erythraea]KGI83037.1 DoxX family protein [Actinopolyspora erythraea]
MPQLPTAVRDLALLLGRVVLGIVFVVHGLQKLTQWGISGTADSFAQMGIPAPGLSAWFAALVETLGGIALIVGVALPLAGTLLAVVMLGALFFVHLSQGFSEYEYVLVLAAASLALGFNGGNYSVDRLLRGSGRSNAAPESANV